MPGNKLIRLSRTAATLFHPCSRSSLKPEGRHNRPAQGWGALLCTPLAQAQSQGHLTLNVPLPQRRVLFLNAEGACVLCSLSRPTTACLEIRATASQRSVSWELHPHCTWFLLLESLPFGLEVIPDAQDILMQCVPSHPCGYQRPIKCSWQRCCLAMATEVTQNCIHVQDHSWVN